NLATGQTGITLRSANYETSRRIEEVARLGIRFNGVLLQNRLYDVLLQVLGNALLDFVVISFTVYSRIVLCGYKNRIHTYRTVTVVLNGYLRLAIRTQILEHA